MDGDAPTVHQDLDAERAVLGGLLLDNRALASVAGVVAPGDFFYPAHGETFGAALAVAARGEPIDVVTLAAELRGRNRLNAVGGLHFLGELTDAVPTVAHIAEHARVVADLAAVRRAVALGRELVALHTKPCSRATAAGLAERLTAATSPKAGRSAPTSLDTELQAAFDRLADVAAGRAAPGLPTGFAGLDHLTGGGLRPGWFVLLAARPAVGKTQMALGWSEAFATRGPVLFVSLEMLRGELVERQLSASAGLDSRRLRAARLAQSEQSALVDAAERLHALPIHYDDSLHSVATLAAVARRHASKAPLAALVVDYVQLLKIDGKHDNREQYVAAISRALKELAKELRCPVVALAQLGRSIEKRGADARPQMSDLRESGGLEADADLIAAIMRPEAHGPVEPHLRGHATLVVMKNRHGPTDDCPLHFHLGRFVDASAPAEPEGI